jgi:hypothetical protein
VELGLKMKIGSATNVKSRWTTKGQKLKNARGKNVKLGRELNRRGNGPKRGDDAPQRKPLGKNGGGRRRDEERHDRSMICKD